MFNISITINLLSLFQFIRAGTGLHDNYFHAFKREKPLTVISEINTILNFKKIMFSNTFNSVYLDLFENNTTLQYKWNVSALFVKRN